MHEAAYTQAPRHSSQVGPTLLALLFGSLENEHIDSVAEVKHAKYPQRGVVNRLECAHTTCMSWFVFFWSRQWVRRRSKVPSTSSTLNFVHEVKNM